MDNKILKELLRDEKRRQRDHRERRDEREKSSRNRNEKNREKERYEKQKEESRFKARELKKEKMSAEPSVEVVPTGKEKFMFVFEDEKGTLYNELSKVPTNGECKIFPVYFSGHNDNLTEEKITFSSDKWRPSKENRENTWLNVINGREENAEVVLFDLKDVVVYNNRFFHCKDDLLDYLEENGCEYLSVI